MANLPLEEIERLVGSRYALTVLAGKRAKELREGAPRLVNTDSSNAIIIALQEILEGKITPEYKGADKTAGVAEGLSGEPAAGGVPGLSGSVEEAARELAAELGIGGDSAQAPVEPGESAAESEVPSAPDVAPVAQDGMDSAEEDEGVGDDDDLEDEDEPGEEGIPQEEF